MTTRRIPENKLYQHVSEKNHPKVRELVKTIDKKAARIFAELEIVDTHNMFKTLERRRTDKQYRYLQGLQTELGDLSFWWLDHVFVRTEKQNIIIESHPYTSGLETKYMKELVELEEMFHHWLKVEILPASYWNLNYTMGIRFTINTKIIKVKQDSMNNYYFVKW
jgi:hypothetical protein